jgi:hypothetical protein
MFASLYVCLATSSSPLMPDFVAGQLESFGLHRRVLTLTAYVLWFRNSSGCFAYVISSLMYASIKSLIGSILLVIQFCRSD